MDLELEWLRQSLGISKGLWICPPGRWIGAKLPMVPPTTIEVLSDDEVEAAVPPVLAGGQPESLPRLRRQWILKLHYQEAA